MITPEVSACRTFYTKYFNFEVIFDSDWYIQLKQDSGIEIGLMLPNLENQPPILHQPFNGTGMVFSFEVEDAKVEYDRLKNLGVSMIFDLKDEEWGQRHFMVSDPAGLIIDIVQQS